MTVGELLEELKGYPAELEVFLSVEDEDGELIDAGATDAYIQLGRLFISGAPL